MSDGWRVVAATVQGASHEKAGVPCQDAHLWRETSQGTLIAAIADGAGSAPCADIGSQIAVSVSLDSVEAALMRENAARIELNGLLWLDEALRQAQKSVENEAKRRSLPIRDFATTLMVLIVTSQFVVAVQIGDGAIVVVNGSGQMEALTRPPVGEYANETTFLSSADALETAQRITRCGHVKALAAFTDGLQRLALRLPAGEPHPPFFAPLFRFAGETMDRTVAEEQLRAFLQSPRIAERADDDLTLLLASQ